MQTIKNIFTLKETFIIHEDARKVGWIKGLIWKRSSAIDYDDHESFWYGKQHERNVVFGHIHKHIESTRLYSQHKCLERYLFFCELLLFLSVVSLIVEICQELYEFLNRKIGEIFQVDFFDLGLLTGLTVFCLFLRFFSPIVQGCGRKKLFQKIHKTIENCNKFHLRPMGYEAKFPQTSKRFCFCLPCCDCCFRRANFSRIQIFDLSERMICECESETFL